MYNYSVYKASLSYLTHKAYLAGLTLQLARVPTIKIQEKSKILFCEIEKNIEKQMISCKSTGREVSFEWSHHRILSIELKVTTWCML